MISLSQEIFQIIIRLSPGAPTRPVMSAGVCQSDAVQDCEDRPPAHQVLGAAQAVQTGGLQLAQCQGESVGGAEREAGSLHGAPG